MFYGPRCRYNTVNILSLSCTVLLKSVACQVRFAIKCCCSTFGYYIHCTLYIQSAIPLFSPSALLVWLLERLLTYKDPALAILRSSVFSFFVLPRVS